MADRIAWGVLGNATIARVCVIPAIQRSRNCRVAAIASRSPESAREIAATNSIARVYDSYGALLEDPQIQAVYIPLPNNLHHPWTLKALEAGKHVLCEKPIACDARQAREMAAAAAHADRLLMEAFMYRFHPRSRRIKEMVAKGAIGNTCLVRSAFCYHMAEDLLNSSECARLKHEMGGGALLDVGCYGVSVTRWILEDEPTHVQGQAFHNSCGVDVHFVGSLRFSNRRLATLEASFISTLQQTYTIVGSAGAIELPHDAFIPWEKDAMFTLRGVDEESGTMHITPGADEYQLMVEHFADAVLGDTPLAYSPEESIGNMVVLDALAEAARTGGIVSLKGF